MTTPTLSELEREELDRLRKLDQAATPGPWRTANGSGAASVVSEGAGCQIYLNVRTVEIRDTVKRWQADAALIAAMRNALPSLLAKVERAEADAQARSAIAALDLSPEVTEHLVAIRKELAEAYEGKVAALEARAGRLKALVLELVDFAENINWAELRAVEAATHVNRLSAIRREAEEGSK